jgi:DNA excision repair protein ERCC-2
MTSRLSTVMLKRAASEAKKFKYSDAGYIITEIRNILENFTKDLNIGEEKLIEKEDFLEKVNKLGNYNEIVSDFEFIGDAVRETKKQSNIGSLSRFLSAWKGNDDGFVRIVEKTPNSVILSYRCLDPSLVTKDVLENAHSSIIMSGTLNPTDMYKDLLSFPKNSVEKTYKSPFPDENKLALIIPETTTKYSMRSDAQFRRMARICADIVNDVPGSSALFFPSYKVRDMVNHYFSKLCKKTTFLEKSNLTKQEKEDMLNNFKTYKKNGAALLSVASGSFGEGIDLPGVLKSVVVVGIPLPKPDLEAKALINYYNNKFGKGMEYGYIFPAFNKALQSAGRCIRSSKDRGILIFLDQRYAWPMYSKCFPFDWNIKVTKNYLKQINNFFYEK